MNGQDRTSGPPTNKELARKLRKIAMKTTQENVRKVLNQSADRLEKPGHKQTAEKAAVLYSVWDIRKGQNDRLIAFDQPEKECREAMGISHSGFMAALRRGSYKWRIEKRFADEETDEERK